jgi:plasmid replication initiation protein
MVVGKTLDQRVTKSNVLVDATYRLTLAEHRVMLLVLSRLDPRPGATVESSHEIDAQTYSATYAVGMDAAYVQLNEAAERLFNRAVIIRRPDPDNPEIIYTKTRWVQAVDYVQDQGRIRVLLADRILPYLTQIAREFTSYRLAHVAPMTTVNAVRLYEMLTQWRSRGTLEVSLKAFQDSLALNGRYPRYYDLKRFVLNPAIRQVNAFSDLRVSLSERKHRRQVKTLLFTFTAAEEIAVLPAPSPKPKLTRQYIEHHARPGETWDDARIRLSKRE